MSTRATWFVTCDICGESDGYSHAEDVARREVRRHGWVRVRNDEGALVDMCWRCVEQAEEQSAKRQSEVQP